MKFHTILKYLPVVIIILFLGIRSKTVNEDFLTNRQDSILASFCEKKADALNESIISTGAAAYYEKAADHYLKTNNIIPAIRNYRKSGVSLFEKYDFTKSEELLLKAKDLLPESKSNNSLLLVEEEEICYNLGILYLGIRKYSYAEEYIKKGLNIVNILKQHKIKLYSKNVEYFTLLSQIQYDLGNIEKSLEYNLLGYDLAVSYFGINSFEAGNNYFRRGQIYSYLEDLNKSIGFYKKALSLFIEGEYKNSVLTSACYNNIGNIYLYMEKYTASLNYYIKSLEIAKLLFDEKSIFIANIYSNLANIHHNLKNESKSINYSNDALETYNMILGDNSSQVAMEFDNQGSMFLQSENYEEAIIKFKHALNIRKNQFDSKNLFISQSFINVALTLFKLNQLDSACYYIQSAMISMVENFNDTNIASNPDIIIQKTTPKSNRINIKYSYFSLPDLISIFTLKSDILFSKYQKDNDVFYLKLSYSTIKTAVILSDYQKDQFSSTQTKLLFQKQNKILFNTAIKIYTHLEKENIITGFSELFTLSEKSKNHILLSEILGKKALNIAGIPVKTLQQERELKNKISDITLRLNELKQNNNNIDDRNILQIESELFSNQQKYDSLVSILEKEHPQYQQFINRSLLYSVKDIQSKLKMNESLLEYYFRENTLHIFIINSNDFITKTIEINNLNELISDFNKNINTLDLRKSIESGNTLFNILINPIKKYLVNKTRLIIIPDDQLIYVPFEALVSSYEINNNSIKFVSKKYLIEDFEIVYNYSAGLWLNSEEANSIIQKDDLLNIKPKGEFIGFAPVSFKDQKINEIPDNTINDDFNERGTNFSNLPNSEHEIRSIANLFEKSGKKTIIFLFNKATKENFIIEAGNYKIIHIATHGYVDEFKNNMPGLVFASKNESDLNIDSNSISTFSNNTNNVLYSNDFSNITLNADLITLSACESARGNIIQGEGIINMVRELIYSGANNILASLFKISDKNTSTLMLDFYKIIQNQKSYSESLHEAKLNMLKNENTSFPFYWCSFVLVGN